MYATELVVDCSLNDRKCLVDVERGCVSEVLTLSSRDRFELFFCEVAYSASF